MTNAIEMRGITKVFGDFTANSMIDFEVRPGEVHALLGENGAGKTTLMNCLFGMLQPTSGEILVQGKPAKITNPRKAIGLGIGMVHQHFMLVENFSVAENIILGQEGSSPWFLSRRRAEEKVASLAQQFGLKVEPRALVQDLSVGQQQKVEILKALYRGAQVLILDEPTAVLTPQEILDLGQTLNRLTGEGKSVILITHKLKEIMTMAHRVTVIRRGQRIGTQAVKGLQEEQLAEMMVGRRVILHIDKAPANPGAPVLELRGLRVPGSRGLEAVKGLSLELKAGEIYGLAGVDGNGQAELAQALAGLRPCSQGQILLQGVPVQNKSPREVFERGLACIPADRQKDGLVLEFSLAQNLILKTFRRRPFSLRGFLNFTAMGTWARELLGKFDVRPPEPQAPAGSLSGGNQQKVIIARELSGGPQVVLAVQPTRGLDVGAIEYVHQALVAQRDAGRAVLLISYELDEILGLSDRIGVMFEGRIQQEFLPGAPEAQVGLAMAGGAHEKA